MPFRKLMPFGALLACCLLGTVGFADASSFSAVVVYGDSLSDNGNVYKASQALLGTGVPGPPYYMGRFSNGPVAVEQLASALGSPLLDLAYGGATSGAGNVLDGGSTTSRGLYGLPGLAAEFAASQSSLTPGLLATGLFVVFGGANDLPAGGTAAAGAANIDAIVATLLAEGAQHVIVPGVPDLGMTPEDAANAAAATQFAKDFNAALLAGLPKGATYVDTFSLLDAVVKTPSLYGFTNATDPCFNGVTVCANPDQYVFWDSEHPTTKVDALLSNALLAAAVPVQTPEPSSWMLLGSGMAGLGVMVRRARLKLAV